MNFSNQFQSSASNFLKDSINEKYSYNFSWMGRPIIQYPQDLVAVQEIIWDVKPDLIIETGVAHGGSAVFFASLLELNAQCDGPKDAVVWCVEIDLRAHNRGSSVDIDIASIIADKAAKCKQVMVILDSNHTHDHVLQELNLYASLVSVDSYCVVFDTVIEDLDGVEFTDRPWGKGDNPKTAVSEFLMTNSDFIVDHLIDEKLLISVAPGGYLKRVK